MFAKGHVKHLYYIRGGHCSFPNCESRDRLVFDGDILDGDVFASPIALELIGL